jgi:LacI family transcriptional regulator
MPSRPSLVDVAHKAGASPATVDRVLHARAGTAKRVNAAGGAHELLWIFDEHTPHARRALIDGTADAVINQDGDHEVRFACRIAVGAIHGERVLADKGRIRIDVFVRNNLP